MRLFTSIFMILSLALSASFASAETKIGGDVEIDVETGHVLTVAAGLASKANTNVGSVGRNTKVGGDLELDVETGHILTVAAGLAAKANTNIGSIGK